MSRQYLLSRQQSAKYRYIFQDSGLRKDKGDVEDSEVYISEKCVRLLTNLLYKMITLWRWTLSLFTVARRCTRSCHYIKITLSIKLSWCRLTAYVRIYALYVYISIFDVYYVISRYIMKSTFPRAKSYSVCDQYWSKDNLIANVRLIIDVPQHIECTSIVGYFIDKIVVTCITILIRIGTSFNPFRNDSDQNYASTGTNVKICIFDYDWRKNVFRDNFCERNINVYSFKKDSIPQDRGNGKG